MHIKFLLQCLDLAASRQGYTAPNPAVGAVVVKNGVVVATGVHYQAGMPHAEQIALQQAGDLARGAILYVSLEPCCHWGKTPPCVLAIQAAGIAAVYYAQLDPDARVAGMGQEFLQQHGIACTHIPLPAAESFYAAYVRWQQMQLPWLCLKQAITANFMLAARDKSPMSITGAAANCYTQQLRSRHDAILSTVVTVKNDNPAFNVRLQSGVASKDIYVLDSNLDLPLDVQLWQSAKSITIFYAGGASVEKLMRLQDMGACCVPLPVSAAGLDLDVMLRYIGACNCHALWVECGARLAQQLLQRKLVQQFIVYHAPHAVLDAYPWGLCLPDLLARCTSQQQFMLGQDRCYNIFL